MTRYIEGSTARQLDQEDYRKKIKKKKRRVAPIVEQESPMHMDFLFVSALTIAMICSLYICVSYLGLQSTIKARIDHIEKLEQQIETLKNDNDALETRIETSINLDEIYRIATEELGMVYPNKKQIRFYDRTENGYVRQYEDIPE